MKKTSSVEVRPLLTTKLCTPPARPSAVERLRLGERLNDGLRRKLTLISAPAGYGKTTLLAEWDAQALTPLVWLSLDEGDNDPARFWVYAIAALQRLQPELGKSALTLLQSTPPPPITSILTTLINDLTAFPGNFSLIIDDYHLITAQPIHDAVTFLLEHLPATMRLIVLTRTDPPLPLARLRARHQLVEIRADDLRFTLDETADFLNRVMGLSLSPENVMALEQHTEGWVAGLQLAALSMQGHDHPNNFVKTFNGNHAFLVGYLAAEILQHLPLNLQNFLLKTSILDRLCGPLCDAILETAPDHSDGQATLEQLYGANLFLIPLDEEQRWYRYHHLFAEFLRHRLEAQASANTLRVLHRRAGAWHSVHGSIETAIDHLLTAADFDRAAPLIESQCEIWMKHGEVSTILRKLRQLPEGLAWGSIGLCLWFGWALAITTDLTAAERWTDRAEALITPGYGQLSTNDASPLAINLRTAYGQALAIRALIARRKGKFPLAADLSWQALTLIPKYNLSLRAIVSTNLSSVILETGNVDHAEIALQTARQMAHAARNPYILFMALMNESALAILRGQLDLARQINLQALHLTESENLPQLTALPHLRLGRLYYFWNDLSQAQTHLSIGLKLIDPSEYAPHRVNGLITLAMTHCAQERPQAAFATLAEAARFALEDHIPDWEDRVYAWQARLQLRAGDLEAAIRWARASGWWAFDPDQPGPAFTDDAFFTLCRTLIAQAQAKDLSRAKQLLEWWLRDSENQKRTGTSIECLLLLALLCRAQHQLDCALELLTQALTLAQPENQIRLFVDEGELLAGLLARIPHSHPTREYAARLLAAFPTEAAPPASAVSLVEPLNSHEFKILRLLAKGYSNPDIARERVLAVSTVRWYVKHIYRKLGVHNRTQAADRARELNLL